MNTSIFQGELVRLVAPNAETCGETFARWSRDSEFARQLDSEPARLWSLKPTKDWWEKELDSGSHKFLFLIRALADDRLIGFIELDGVRWTHGESFVSIGIGERDYRGKGYGTDAMKVILRYAFTELNLHRVSLDVFEYNPRAIRSYEKAGFVIEGRQRQFLKREGRRWDMIYMGILREEWERRT